VPLGCITTADTSAPTATSAIFFSAGRPFAQSTEKTETVPASRFAATTRVSSGETAMDALWLGSGEGLRGSATASSFTEPSGLLPPPSGFGVIPPEPRSSSPQPWRPAHTAAIKGAANAQPWKRI
jgi:hypothetical protein